MWNEQKQMRFEALRQRELDNTLTESEQTELTELIQEIESGEAAYLNPGTAQLRYEREQLEAQNHALQILAQRKQALVARLHVTLAEAITERRNIEAELAHILGQPLLLKLDHTG